MTPPLIDSHCHLDVKEFDVDRPDVIRRAGLAGIAAMMTLGTDLRSSGRAVDLALGNASVFAAVGLHPNDAAGDDPVDWAAFQSLAEHPNVIAWGEIGLDYYWDTTAPERQKNVFRDQLAIARDLKLPISVHIRKAHDDTMAILAEVPYKDVTGILHCWSGSLEEARHAVDMGYLIGIGGPVTYKNSVTPDIVAELPWDVLVVETDAPYLAPVPRRGKRNEPHLVRHTFNKLVETKNDKSPDEAAAQLWHNFLRVFGRFTLTYETACPS